MGFDSPVHWVIVILIIALLFGGSRVGSLMGELGKGLRSFKQNLADPSEAKPAPARIAEAAPSPAVVTPLSARDAEAVARPVAEPALPPDAERR